MAKKRSMKQTQKKRNQKQLTKQPKIVNMTDSKELIIIEKQTIGKEEVNSVDARELWIFLESKQEYTTWITKRIKDYDFLENQNFITFDRKIKRKNNVRGSSIRKEYTIKIDMAKELSMVERNQKGKEARKYFIEMEKIAKKITPTNYIEALEQLVISEKQKLILEETNKKVQKELEYKEEVIDGICKSIGLEAQRQVLNKVVRFKGSDFQKRWQLLYDHFSRKYHMNLQIRRAKYDATHKYKSKSMVDFVENGLGMLGELYEIALKLYESDINEIIDHYKDIY